MKGRKKKKSLKKKKEGKEEEGTEASGKERTPVIEKVEGASYCVAGKKEEEACSFFTTSLEKTILP